MKFAGCLPKLQMPAGELVQTFAHFTPPLPQKNTAGVGCVYNQHPDPNSGTFHGFIWHLDNIKKNTSHR